jgi:hypothetical protein
VKAKGRTVSLAYICFDAANGDPELALCLAVRAILLYEQGLTPRSQALRFAVEAARRQVLQVGREEEEQWQLARTA